ncbi:unnamed protein product [Paramecium pentaurelia]|uniref:DNA-directed RNA polymerases I and III subunit RPAC1 n=1 Tax=Paramecium pentaurelia TaxID=43138 RepID=A0A8S1U5Y5_9CILI|nr:unnamed protein product [Paramecium pentaurelia]
MDQHKLQFKEDQIMKPFKQERFNIKQFQRDLEINILSKTDEKIVFEIINIDAPIANSLRRIMIAEIPTMAIHKVQVIQNTSVIPDEVLAHRLGLIPIIADPLQFIEKDDQEEYNELNSIDFTLFAKCEKKPNSKQDDPIEQQYTNTTVYSSSLIWQPKGQQAKLFAANPIRPVHSNIIIAKLRENQELNLRLICEKGVGKRHAKWSPVCTAFYKLMPSITIKNQLDSQRQEKLASICPMKVFGIKGNQIKVVNPRNCTTCRECIREANGFDKDVELNKIDNHFIFSIESVGQYEAKDIMLQAIDVFRSKVQLYIKE